MSLMTCLIGSEGVDGTINKKPSNRKKFPQNLKGPGPLTGLTFLEMDCSKMLLLETGVHLNHHNHNNMMADYIASENVCIPSARQQGTGQKHL